WESREWVWVVGRDAAPAAPAESAGALPVRMYILIPFVALMLVVVGATAYATLRSAEEGATTLATRLHEEVAANIDLRLDEYLASSPAQNDSARIAAIGGLLSNLPIARIGR